MDATGISHIALCVRDMDKSLEFYRDILGMRVTADGPTDPTEGAGPTTTPTGGPLAGGSALATEKSEPPRP